MVPWLSSKLKIRKKIETNKLAIIRANTYLNLDIIIQESFLVFCVASWME
jgi:hypothetical protein